MKIYTKIGDGGETYLLGGRKVSKDHPRVKAYGDVDELNSVLGWARSLSGPRFSQELEHIQRDLFSLGAELASAGGPPPTDPVDNARVHSLERAIDGMDGRLPPLRHFILPGGSPAAAALHAARSVCRRAERSVATLRRRGRVRPDVLIYLNRLSDYLFVLARVVNRSRRVQDCLWMGRDKEIPNRPPARRRRPNG